MIRHLRLWLGGLLLMAVAQAQPLLWSSDTDQTNLDSAGVLMDSGFVFELGSFSGGFQPDPGNVAQWSAHWVVVDSASYDVADQRFNRLYQVTAEPAPLATGGAAWVMGTRVGATGTERILFRKGSWTWPTPDELNPVAIQWNAKQADQVVLGTVDADASPFLMQSAMTLSYAQWQSTTLAGESENGSEEDPDDDGASNLVEFAFGTSPTNAGEVPVIGVAIAEVSGMEYLQLSVPRLRDREVNLVVEVSGDLIDWDSGAEFTEVVSDSESLLVVRDLTSSTAAGGKRFARVRVSLAGP